MNSTKENNTKNQANNNITALIINELSSTKVLPHKKLISIWITKIQKAKLSFALENPLFDNSLKDKPIMKNRKLHIGKKSHWGGEKGDAT